MTEDMLRDRLRRSVARQAQQMRSSLILNPVENVPFASDVAIYASDLHGLYNSDKVRTRDQRSGTQIQFAGRTALEADSRAVYDAWAAALHAEDATLRLLSGLHAHIVLFMSLSRPGEVVMTLPVEAGGHMSTRAILERLGLRVVEMVVDGGDLGIDRAATLRRAEVEAPDYVLVDRSEGLVFEDFSFLASLDATTIFDASQYLTNVVCGHHQNPLDWGFDLLLATTHKNFPGPQKALIATRRSDDRWRAILRGVSTYVSNMHVAGTYAAGMALARRAWLTQYSSTMLEVATALEEELSARGVPMVRRATSLPPTHHLWLKERDRASAFDTYERLECCGVLTNFRKLPYQQGYGVRMGVNAAVRLGLTTSDVPTIAEIISGVWSDGATSASSLAVAEFSAELWSRAEAEIEDEV